jgi:hypothetical protein
MILLSPLSEADTNKKNPPSSPFYKGGYYSSLWQSLPALDHVRFRACR